MNKDSPRNRIGGVLFPALALVVAATSVIAHAVWDRGRNVKCEGAHHQAIADIRRELRKTRNDLLATRADLQKAELEMARARTEAQKLETLTARFSEARNLLAKEHPRTSVAGGFAGIAQTDQSDPGIFETLLPQAGVMIGIPYFLPQECMKTFLLPIPVEKAAGPGAGSRNERDARERAGAAAIADAIAFEYNNSNAKKEKIAARYREVADRFPDTVAAVQAAGILETILKQDK